MSYEDLISDILRSSTGSNDNDTGPERPFNMVFNVTGPITINGPVTIGPSRCRRRSPLSAEAVQRLLNLPPYKP